jgi:cytochrome-b5 reductase
VGRLDPAAWTPFTVAATTRINHNTFRLTVALADTSKTAGEAMPPASCLLARLPVGAVGDDGRAKHVMRPYTPVNAPGDRGRLDLVVKEYEGGKLTPHLARLMKGDTVELKGPIPKLPVGGEYDHIGFAAGGTGIAPALQVAHAALEAGPRTRLTILYGSVSPDDVICKKELDALAARHPGRVKVVYTVDAAPPGSGWTGRVGYIDAALLKAELPPPGAPGNNIVMVCGPPGQMDALSGKTAKVDGKKVQGPLSGALKELGYTESDVFKF